VPLVMGVDSSTTATKVELRDAVSGDLVATGRAPHPPAGPPVAEQDPAAWWKALTRAAREAGAAEAAAGTEIAAVAVAGQQHGLVALDDERNVLRPAKLWNDNESAPDAAWLVEQLGGPGQWAEACGSVPVASFTITKLSWLHRNEPATFDRLAHVLLPHDWLTYGLTGELSTDRGDASGTGYWSPAGGEWRTDLLDIVDAGRDWGVMLPAVRGPAEPAGPAQRLAAVALGLADGAVVGPGTGDNMAAALGLGLRPGDVAVSLGTSGTVYTVSDRAVADATGAVAGFADATGRFLPLVCTVNATRVTDAVARLLGVDGDTLARLALDGPPGAGGVVLVPHLDGERTPNRPAATGLLAGFRSDVTREQVSRAAHEGVVCGLLDGLDALAALGLPVGGRLFLVGGGARSAAYPRLLAGLTGQQVIVPAGEEHVAMGAAVQAAAVLQGGTPEDVAAAWGGGTGHAVDPDLAVPREEVRAAYAAARDR